MKRAKESKPHRGPKGVKLPSGFGIISGIGAAWKPKPGESITGVLTYVKIVKLPKKGKEPARDWPIYTIRTRSGDIEVGESAGLRSLSKVKKGREVFIQFLGLKKISKSKNPMRDFLVATK